MAIPGVQPKGNEAFSADSVVTLRQALSGVRVAFVHDWLVTAAGSEQVLAAMLEVVPTADLFAVVDFLPADARSRILSKRAKTTFLQQVPFCRKFYRSLLPLMPLALEQVDLSDYDLIISSSHAVAKGVLTGPDQLHVCMCYSPMRYAWDLQHQYLRQANLGYGPRGLYARFVLHRMRQWDLASSYGVDEFIGISEFITKRIKKIYRRDAYMIYPPVNVEKFLLQESKQDFYLTASRLVPYKRVDLIVEAFARTPARRLVVIGDGPEFKKIAGLTGPNIQMMGHQPDSVLVDHMQRARAFVFAAEEDFGIAPLEAQASGTPVIAFGKGGALETIRGPNHPAPTGVFFPQQTPESLEAALAVFEQDRSLFSPQACRENAMRFSSARFHANFASLIFQLWKRHRRGGIDQSVIPLKMESL